MELPEKRNKKSQENKAYGIDRISSESDDDDLCGFSGIARRSALSTLKATGYRINSAECVTMKNVLHQVAGRCVLVESVTEPNSPSTDPNSPTILQKVAICGALGNQ
jgi:hypothetical protein